MIRTQIYLTEEEKVGLEAIAVVHGKTQSDLIRIAIDELIANQSIGSKDKVLNEIAGIWKKRTDIPNVRALRKGWRNRPVR